MRKLVLGLAALALLGGCFYIKVDDHADDRDNARDRDRNRETTDCSASSTASCKPE